MFLKIAKKAKIVIRSFLILSKDPFSVRYYFSWLRSLFKESCGLDNRIPLITFKARLWLESYLKPDMAVFEYGSGNSTIYLSIRVKKLVSVEHDKVWHRRILNKFSEDKILNCEYLLIEPEKLVSKKYNSNNYVSLGTEYVGMSFERYVKSIDKFMDKSFDLVIIDGRARSSCITHALKKIRPGGYLMLDDSERERYYKATSLLGNYKRMDFCGIAPCSMELKQTSVWRIS